MKFKTAEVPKELLQLLIMNGSELGSVEAWMTDSGLRILRSIDHTEHGRLLHISISAANQYPRWDQILECKYQFFGDKTAIMVFPRKELYVNLHKNCFHLWELPKIPGSTGDWELS